MGSKFCNLFCREEHASILKNGLSSGDKFHTGYYGWCMAAAEDRNPDNMTRVAKKIPGDALLFFYFDDDFFELTYYKNGRKIAAINNNGKGNKISAFADLLPDDPDALKKLRAAGICATMAEKIALFEETFGLPFYAFSDQETIPAVRKNDRIWKAVTARVEELRKRPNRFTLRELDRSEWPDSVKIKINLIERLRGRVPAYQLDNILRYLSLKWSLTQNGRPSLLLFPTYINRDNKKFTEGYNTVFAVDYPQGEETVFSFPFSVASPLMLNKNKAIVCHTNKGNAIVCLNKDGVEQWKFSPDPKRIRTLHSVRTDCEEIVLYTSDLDETTGDRIWRISPEDGSVLTERVMPVGESLYPLHWTPEMECFVYSMFSLPSQPEDYQVVLLDRDFNEIRRFRLEKRFNLDFSSGNYGYGQEYRSDDSFDLVRLDLNTGEIARIHPEVPACLYKVSASIFENPTDGNVMTLFDSDGKVISRHRFKGKLLGTSWEENGKIYAAAAKRNDVQLIREEDTDILVRLFLFEDLKKP